MFDHAEQARIRAEQILAKVSATLHQKLLVLPVGDFAQTPHQQPVAVVLNKAVPIAAPDHLDNVPARAAENGFQFLNDLAITAYWPIKPLQVAVNDPDQVIESLARGQRN